MLNNSKGGYFHAILMMPRLNPFSNTGGRVSALHALILEGIVAQTDNGERRCREIGMERHGLFLPVQILPES
jgi:hypothetical protein